MQSSSEIERRFMGVEKELTICDPNNRDTNSLYWLSKQSDFYHTPFDGVASSIRNPEWAVAFLNNGGLWYLDWGNPEYATPECSGFEQLTDYVVGADTFVTKAIDHHLRLFNDGSPDFQRTARLHNRVASDDGDSKGFHENYDMVRRNGMTAEEIADRMVGFLIGRTVFNGGGFVELNESGQPVVMPAQKARLIVKASSTGTLYSKPWIADRAHADYNDDAAARLRLQIVGGDPNMSPAAARITFATTSIVLRLIENGIEPNLRVSNVAKVTQTAARDWQAKTNLDVEINGKRRRRRPIDIMEIYYETALQHIDRGIFSDEELAFLPEWGQLIDDFRHNRDSLATTIDWICKQMIMERRDIHDLARMRATDLHYDALYGTPEQSSIGKRMRDSGLYTHNVSPQTTEHTIFHAPTESRAHIRAELIAAMRKLPESTGTHKKAHWTSVAYNYPTDGFDNRTGYKTNLSVNLSKLNGELSPGSEADRQRILDMADRYSDDDAIAA